MTSEEHSEACGNNMIENEENASGVSDSGSSNGNTMAVIPLNLSTSFDPSENASGVSDSGSSNGNTMAVIALNPCKSFDPSIPVEDIGQLLALSTFLHTTSCQTGPDEAERDKQQPLNAEDATFLKNSLAKLSVNGNEELERLMINVAEIKPAMQNPEFRQSDDYEAFVETRIKDLVELQDIIYHTVMSILFFQLGGLEIMLEIVESSVEASLRSMAANIIAECCRNNARCQKYATVDTVFISLIKVANEDENITARFKAISAMSAIIHNNPDSIELFRKHDGLDMLVKALDSGNDKIILKATFLTIALCVTDRTIKEKLVEVGVLEQYLNLLFTSTDNFANEIMMHALVLLAEDPNKLSECKGYSELANFLRNAISMHGEHETLQELVTHARDLLKMIENINVSDGKLSQESAENYDNKKDPPGLKE